MPKRPTSLRKLAPGQPLPDRGSFKIGEVATMLGVATSLLRFWETEFRVVRPRKSRSQQRQYSQADVERLREIQRLLKVEGYTIAGARRQLARPRLDLAVVTAEIAALTARLEAALAEVAALEKLLAAEPDGAAGAEGA